MKKLLLILIFFVPLSFASAADLSVVAPKIINSQKQFTVAVKLNTDDTLINSIDISLSYPKDLVTFAGYKENESIKKIWILAPKDEDGTIHFTGIIPGGVNGVYDPDNKGLQPIPLIALLFNPKANGDVAFNITDSKVLKNDGKGTPLIYNTNNQIVSINIEKQDPGNDAIKYEDTEGPLPFNIDYIPSGFFSETPSLISFSTTDDKSGVEKYQIKDEHGTWIDVKSPLQVPKGLIWRSIIVRALDYSGNARESSIDIPGIMTSFELLMVLMVFVICYLVFFVVKRKR